MSVIKAAVLLFFWMSFGLCTALAVCWIIELLARLVGG